jgi:hypothetical protein
MNKRRNQRTPFHSTVRVSWTDEHGSANLARGTCRDISENGICLKIPNAIPVGTYVGLSVEALGLNGSASVRHTARNATTTFTMGLDLSQSVPARALLSRLCRDGISGCSQVSNSQDPNS